NAVPRAEQAEVGAEEDQAPSRVFVLARAASRDRRLPGTRPWVLDALPLTEGVVGEHDVPLAREIRKEFLIARPRFAVHGMPERSQDRRPAPGGSRYIEIRRDIEARAALECQLLDAVPGPLDRAGHLRIEGRSLERPSKHLPERLDHRF